jgi:hypothetical protein
MMVDEKQRPTLQDLSKQLLVLCDDCEDLHYGLHEEEELPKAKRKSEEELLAMVAELLCKVNNVRKTAIATQHPIALEGSDYPSNKVWSGMFLLDEASEFLEEVLFRMIEAKKKQRKYLLEGMKALPRDFKSPLQWAIEGYCYCGCSEYREHFGDTEGFIQPIREAANQFAGIFLKEQLESEQGGVFSEDLQKNIPPQRRSTP